MFLALAVAASAFGQLNFSQCDINHDGAIDVKDAKVMVNQAQGQAAPANDLAGIGVVNVVAIQSEINGILFGCPYYAPTPRFAITNVTVLNQAWIPSDIPSPGNLTLRNAFGSPTSLLNQAFIAADIPSPGNLTLHGAFSAGVSLVNQFWNPADIPSPGNLTVHGAVSREVSLVNQAWISADVPSPGNLRFAAGLLVSVNNNAPAGMLPTIAASGLKVVGAGSSTTPVDFASIHDGDALLVGQTVRLRLYPPDETASGADFLLNGSLLRIHTPFEVLLTAPANVTTLDLEAAVYSEGGRVWRSPTKRLLVVPDPGLNLTGRAVLDNRAPAPSSAVGLRANGLTAEYFRADKGFSSWTDLSRPADKRGFVTAVNQPETTALGIDPFGAGLSGDFAARFRGEILIAAAGSHQFFLGAYLGGRLLIDGTPLIDSPPGNFSPETQAAVELTAGWHTLEIDSYQTSSSPGLQFSWRQPNSLREVVRPEALAAEFGSQAVTGADGAFRLAAFPTILNPLEWHPLPADQQIRIVVDPSTSPERPIQQ